MVLCYQGKLCLFHGRNVERWLCAPKANHVCFADGILEIDFVVPNQIIFLLEQNVKSWLCGPSQIIFVPQIECTQLVSRTKPNDVVAADHMLNNGFVAKASTLKPRLSLLYLKAQMNDTNVS